MNATCTACHSAGMITTNHARLRPQDARAGDFSKIWMILQSN